MTPIGVVRRQRVNRPHTFTNLPLVHAVSTRFNWHSQINFAVFTPLTTIIKSQIVSILFSESLWNFFVVPKFILMFIYTIGSFSLERTSNTGVGLILS